MGLYKFISILLTFSLISSSNLRTENSIAVSSSFFECLMFSEHCRQELLCTISGMSTIDINSDTIGKIKLNQIEKDTIEKCHLKYQNEK